MPPKRKRAEPTEPTSTRATRSSARAVGESTTEVSGGRSSSTATTANQQPAASSSNKAVISDSTVGDGTEGGSNEPSPIKKAKTAKKAAPKAKATPKAKVAKGAKADTTNDEDAVPSKEVPEPPPKPPVKPVLKTPSIPHKAEEPYSASHALKLFQTYADADDPEVIGPEGFQSLCADAQLPLEGALPLIFAWQLDATEMGKLTKTQWVKGMDNLQISSLPQLTIAVKDLEDILILGKKPLKKATSAVTKKGDEPYNRALYWQYAADTSTAFSKLYTFCFAIAKPPQARNIDMETATAFWSVLLAPRYSIMNDVIEFINLKGTYKGANKDLWSMMLEFIQTVKPSLQGYEADGAWPTLMDDFVSWKHSQNGSLAPKDVDEES